MTARSKQPALAVLVVLCTILGTATDAVTGQLPPQLDCLIEPKVTTDISTRAQGVVAEYFADRGDYVEANQVLATLDSAVEKAAVELAKTRSELVGEIQASTASLEFGRRKVDRFDDLFKQKAVSLQTIDETRTELLLAAANLRKAREEKRVAELQLQQAQETLELRTIRSPVKGVVIDRLLAVGESVEDKPIVQVAQIDPLYVEVIVPVKHFGTVELGMQGRVRPENPIGGEYLATVNVVDQVIDAASGTYRIRLELPNPDYALPAGLKCQIEFIAINDKIKRQPAMNNNGEDPKPAIEQAPVLPSPPPAPEPRIVTSEPARNADIVDTAVTVPPTMPAKETLATPAPLEPVVARTALPDPSNQAPTQSPLGIEPVVTEQSVASPTGATAARAEVADVRQEPVDAELAADTAVNRCFSIGPIANLKRLKRFVDSVDTKLAAVEMRNVPSKITRGYVVHSERMPTRAALREMEAKLRKAGVSDLAIIRRGSLAKRLSFGIYRRQSYARKRCSEIEEFGATCRMSSKPGSAPQRWVDVIFHDKKTDLTALHGWLEKAGLARKVTPEVCRPEGQKSAKR